MGKIKNIFLQNKKISPRSQRDFYFTNQLKGNLKHDKNQVDYPHIINLNIHKFNIIIQIL